MKFSLLDVHRRLLMGALLCIPLALSAQVSVYYKNFVRHADGTLCEHAPPRTALQAYLNGVETPMLLEDAPRWDPGDPNIAGNGTFGVELGNFSQPPLQVGDHVFVRFFCQATGQSGTLSDSVAGIPWLVFPRILYLQPLAFPEPPQEVRLTFTPQHFRQLTWQVQPGVRYDVYRFCWVDTLPDGTPRRQYVRLATGLTHGFFVDSTAAAHAHGYRIVPRRQDRAGMHSRLRTDRPGPPRALQAVVSGNAPPQVVLSWLPPEGPGPFIFHIYRSRLPGVEPANATLVGSTDQLVFLDSAVVVDTTYYYRVLAENPLGIPGPPSEEVAVTVTPPLQPEPDLGVAYISRQPRYPRYDVVYDPPGYNPHPRPGTDSIPHWPSPGELVTYRAVIRNHGGSPVPQLEVQWLVDSLPVKVEQFGALYPGQQVISHLQMPWSGGNEKIRCQVMGPPGLNELTLTNNTLEIRARSLSFHFYVEQTIAQLFARHANPMGSYNFADWAQVQIARLNQFFRQAVYPGISPQGVLESVYLDTISYYPDGSLPTGGSHSPHSLLWDGQWGFTGDSNAVHYFQNVVLGQNGGIDWALLHELGHQLGLIDLYNMDVQQSELQVIEPRTGQPPPLQPVAWDVLYYCSRSNYLMHTNFQNGFSDHSAGALMRNLGRRRGYYGDYLADLPVENTLIVNHPDGRPVAHAEIWIYQMQDNVIPNVTKFRGYTDAQGRYQFPHHTDSTYHGGIWVRNPFSTIFSWYPHVVGTNAVLFVRVTRGDSVGYGFIDICDFNVACWRGNCQSATLPITIAQWFLMPATDLPDPVQGDVPRAFRLLPNRPNPFNPETEIPYELPERSRVEIAIYNVLGQRVRTMRTGWQPAGRYVLRWDGRNDRGEPLPSGIYWYRMEARTRAPRSAGSFIQIRKMVFLK